MGNIVNRIVKNKKVVIKYKIKCENPHAHTRNAHSSLPIYWIGIPETRTTIFSQTLNVTWNLTGNSHNSYSYNLFNTNRHSYNVQTFCLSLPKIISATSSSQATVQGNDSLRSPLRGPAAQSHLLVCCNHYQVCTGGLDSKESVHSVGDPSSIPGLGRSPGEANGTHSSILAGRIPWTEEPSGL